PQSLRGLRALDFATYFFFFFSFSESAAMKKLLIEVTKMRLQEEVSTKNPLKVLKTIDIGSLIDTVIPVVYLYTRGNKNETIYFADITCAIGRRVMQEFRLGLDSALAARIGSFMLYNFEVLE